MHSEKNSFFTRIACLCSEARDSLEAALKYNHSKSTTNFRYRDVGRKPIAGCAACQQTTDILLNFIFFLVGYPLRMELVPFNHICFFTAAIQHHGLIFHAPSTRKKNITTATTIDRASTRSHHVFRDGDSKMLYANNTKNLAIYSNILFISAPFLIRDI